MAQDILTSKGTVVTRQNLRKIRKSELICESQKRKPNLFDDIIENKIGRSMSYPNNPIPENNIHYEENSQEAPILFPDNTDPVESDGVAEF